jgi:hypothetical protein
MRKLSTFKILAPMMISALIAPPALAGNGDFESGDLSDWSANTPFGGVSNNYGGYTAQHGDYFAYLDGGIGMDVFSTLSQTFTLQAGQTLTGFAGFKANDYLPFDDSGYLAINGSHLLDWSIGSVGDFGSSGWISFSYTAETAGDYTLELGVANHGDNGFPSTAVLDQVSLSAAPEPASWAMMLAGFGLVGGAMRARSRKLRFA